MVPRFLQRLSHSPAAQATIVYAIVASLWIVLSDEVVAWMFDDDSFLFHRAQTIKGLVFVALMGGLIFFVVDRAHRLRERNRQVEAMLVVSRKLEVVGSFAATMAHDMANVMTLLEMLTDMIKREHEAGRPVDPEHFNSIDRAVDRAQTLVRQLSSFLRKSPEDLKAIDVAKVIAESEDLLRQAASKKVKFETKVQEGLSAIRLPDGGLEQVLLNLVINARHAMENQPAPRRLRIVAERVRLKRHHSIFRPEPTSGDFVRLRVEDTGHGIPESEITKIFDPFYTTKSGDQGTGLGLASVMETFRRHDGWVEVRSSVNRGTIFDLYAPALK